MSNHKFQAHAAGVVLSMLRGERTVEQAVAAIYAYGPASTPARKVKVARRGCYYRNGTCIVHGNDAAACEKDRQ